MIPILPFLYSFTFFRCSVKVSMRNPHKQKCSYKENCNQYVLLENFALQRIFGQESMGFFFLWKWVHVLLARMMVSIALIYSFYFDQISTSGISKRTKNQDTKSLLFWFQPSNLKLPNLSQRQSLPVVIFIVWRSFNSSIQECSFFLG